MRHVDFSRCVYNADRMVICQVEGAGHLLGLETGNNQDMSRPQANERSLFRGRLLAYIRRDAPGSIKVTLKAEGVAFETTIE